MTTIMLSLEDRNDFITVPSGRVPNVGEIVHLPLGNYRVSEVRNLMETVDEGRSYELTSTVVYCTKAASMPAETNLKDLGGEEQAWLTRILTELKFIVASDNRMRSAVLNKLLG